LINSRRLRWSRQFTRTRPHWRPILPADPALIGSSAPRIKGGVDLVGDDYNADPGSSSYQPVPHPDSNPLDCNGHGTHVAGTAAGSGVLATGATYTGAYNANTVSGNSWIVGPGVAPKADIYSIRVFGCAGSTDVVVDAIEWAMDHDMDVINMSLGSAYGGADDPAGRDLARADAAGISP
jgi:subtilisin family serine protease